MAAFFLANGAKGAYGSSHAPVCLLSLGFVTHAGLCACLAQSLMSGEGRADPEGG